MIEVKPTAEVTLYRPKTNIHGEFISMVPDNWGDWVSIDDYDALKADRDALLEALSRIAAIDGPAKQKEIARLAIASAEQHKKGGE